MTQVLRLMEAADAAYRVRSHFVEMPSLRVTVAQAIRLFDLTEDVCVSILSALVQEGWLAPTRDGMYARPQVH